MTKTEYEGVAQPNGQSLDEFPAAWAEWNRQHPIVVLDAGNPSVEVCMRHLYDNMLWGRFSLAPKAQATVEAIMLAVPQDCAPSSFWPNEDGEFCIGWDAQDGAVFSLEVNDYGAISWTVSEMEQAISFDI